MGQQECHLALEDARRPQLERANPILESSFVVRIGWAEVRLENRGRTRRKEPSARSRPVPQHYGLLPVDEPFLRGPALWTSESKPDLQLQSPIVSGFGKPGPSKRPGAVRLVRAAK